MDPAIHPFDFGDGSLHTTTAQVSPGQGKKPTNAGEWLVGNLVAPALDSAVIEPVNAVINIIDTVGSAFSKRPVISKLHLMSLAPPQNPLDSLVQTGASGLGALAPYLLAGHALGAGMRSIGNALGVKGEAARVLASQSVANVAAAGIYDYARDPYPSESRIGNAMGSMFSFSLFEHFNPKLGALKWEGRFPALYGLGAAGGASQYGISRVLAGQNISLTDMLNTAITNGAFNAALPTGQRSSDSVANAIDSRLHRGIPVARLMRGHDWAGLSPTLDRLSAEQPLARVVLEDKGPSFADHAKNTVHAKADPAFVGHELSHLKTGSSADAKAQWHMVNSLLDDGKPNDAWEAYREMRGEQENKAIQVEQKIRNEVSHTNKPSQSLNTDQIANMHAAGNDTFDQIWRKQFDAYSADRNPRSQIDFHGAG